jgi:hypothetical protein
MSMNLCPVPLSYKQRIHLTSHFPLPSKRYTRAQQPQISHLEIRNTGPSIVHWHFIPKLDEDRVCKRWISFSLESGLLLPGESVTVDLTVLVDRRSAQILNAGKDVRCS